MGERSCMSRLPDRSRLPDGAPRALQAPAQPGPGMSPSCCIIVGTSAGGTIQVPARSPASCAVCGISLDTGIRPSRATTSTRRSHSAGGRPGSSLWQRPPRSCRCRGDRPSRRGAAPPRGPFHPRGRGPVDGGRRPVLDRGAGATARRGGVRYAGGPGAARTAGREADARRTPAVIRSVPVGPLRCRGARPIAAPATARRDPPPVSRSHTIRRSTGGSRDRN